MECDGVISLLLHHFSISIHALTWSATTALAGATCNDEGNFNPRTHMECDLGSNRWDILGGDISIHALTWSATGFLINSFSYIDISIHALTWSATC